MKMKQENRYKWLALSTVAIGTYMSTLVASIVNISFPSLTRVFSTDASVVMWVSVAFLLVSVSLVFVFGKMGDIFGRKKIYTIGFAIFTVGLILCALSQSILQLIMARVVQAVGASMTVALGNAIITAIFPSEERGKALGIMAATVSAGLLSGPVLGGVLVDWLDWRAIFYIPIPIAIAGMIMAITCLKEQKIANEKWRFDWWGAAALSIGLACLLLFFNFGGKEGFGEPLAITFGIATLILIILFVFIERKTSQPILDLKLFRNRLFSTGNISLVIMFIATSANMFLMPFYLIQGLGYSTSYAGFIYASVPLTTLIVGPFSGWLSDKIGYRLLCTAGMALMTGGLFWLSQLGTGLQVIAIILPLVMVGVGSGLFSSPNNSSIMGSVPREKLTTGSAMIVTMRQVGMSCGMALAGSLFISQQTKFLAELPTTTPITPEIERMSVVASFQDTVFISCIICAVAVIVSALQGTAKPQAKGQDENYKLSSRKT
jgi:EmrB/QacA subfamily drug resistance transporter